MRARLPNSPFGFDEQEGTAATIVVIAVIAFFLGAFALKVADQGWPTFAKVFGS